MQRLIRHFLNVFIAITLAAFAMSTILSSAFAGGSKSDTSFSHMADGQNSDKTSDHQNNGQCDDGCCINHCFHCAGFAIPTTETFSILSVSSTGTLIFADQKAEGSSTVPQLRPPKHLA